MRQLRIFYAAGPGHVIGTFIHWKAGRDEPSEPAVPYSAQFYDVCRELNARGYVVTACPQRGRLREGLFQLEHRPYKLRNASGLLYHLGQIWNGLRLMASAVRFRADVAIIAEGSHWFLFALLPLAGIRVVPSLQSRVFNPTRNHRLPHRMICRLNGWFFARACFGVISMPYELTQQVQQISKGRCKRCLEFLPFYRRDTFEQVAPPGFLARPFRVLYAGRIEAEKGVFDLLHIARRFQTEGRRDVEFDICGDGAALASLRAAAARAGATERFHCHGHCNRLQLHELYARSHVVVVPTKTDSGEGFNKVTVEAVLCGRPVVTSSAWTAWKPFVSAAVVEVPANDAQAYGDAIIGLMTDRQLYESKRQACLALQAQFCDATRSWGAALRRIVVAARGECALEPYRLPLASTCHKCSTDLP